MASNVVKIDVIANTKEASTRLDRLSGKIGGLGRAVLIPAAALLGLGVASVKMAIDFESAFAGVRKTVEASEAEFAVLREGIRDMAKELPASAVSIAAVAEAAGQLGIETKNILGFTRTMIDLGETTNLSANEAATALARLANITQLPQTEFDRLGSTIVALGNNLATTEAEIVEMGLRLAAAGEQIGLTEAQILSFAGALSSLGIRAEAGGTAFSRVMLDMSKAVATGSEDLEVFAAVAGQSVGEFAKLFRDDASAAVTTFIEGMGKLSDAELFAALDELGFANVRVRDALLRSAGASDLLRNSLELGEQAWIDNTALTEEAEKRYNTTGAQLSILRNNVVDLGITLGDTLMPALRAVNEALLEGGGMERFASTVEDFLPVLVQFGRDIKRVFSFIIDNRAATVAAIVAVGVAFAWAFPGGAVIIGLGALITTIALLRTDMSKLGISAVELQLRFLGLADTILDTADFLIERLLPGIPVVGSALSSLGASVLGLTDAQARLVGKIENTRVTLLNLQAEAAVNNFGEMIVAQAHGAEVSMLNLRAAMENVFRTMDALAAQGAAFGFTASEAGLTLPVVVEPPVVPPPVVPPPVPDPNESGKEWGGAFAGAVEDAVAEMLERIERMTREGLLGLSDAIAQWGTDVSQTIIAALAGLEAASESMAQLFEKAVERGFVTLQDIDALVQLGPQADAMALDFIDAFQGTGSEIGDAITEGVAERAAEEAAEAAEEFAKAWDEGLDDLRSATLEAFAEISNIMDQATIESSLLRQEMLFKELEIMELQKSALMERAALDEEISQFQSHIVDALENQEAGLARINALISDRRGIISDILGEIRSLESAALAAARILGVDVAGVAAPSENKLIATARELQAARDALAGVIATGSDEEIVAARKRIDRAKAAFAAEEAAVEAQLAAAKQRHEAQLKALAEEEAAKQRLIDQTATVVEFLQRHIDALERTVTPSEAAITTLQDWIDAQEEAARVQAIENDLFGIYLQLSRDLLPTQSDLNDLLFIQIDKWGTLNSLLGEVEQGVFDVTDAFAIMLAGFSGLLLPAGAGGAALSGGASSPALLGTGESIPVPGLQPVTIVADRVEVHIDADGNLSSIGLSVPD